MADVYAGAAASFDAVLCAAARSNAYREAVRAAMPGLPDWLAPFSVVTERMFARVIAELRLGSGDRLIDLCCGSGGPGVAIAERTGAALTGVDFAREAVGLAAALASARGLESARFVVADGTATELPPASADAVLCIDALMFLDPNAVASEAARLLESGGRFVATAAVSLGEPFTPTLVRDYRPIFESAGFEITAYEDVAGHAEAQLALYRALREREPQLLAEMGDAAGVLIDEARHGILRAEQNTTRVRQILLAAERIGGPRG